MIVDGRDGRATPGVQLHGRYWPVRVAMPVDVTMTPREAWVAWLGRVITAEEFGRILDAWEAAAR